MRLGIATFAALAAGTACLWSSLDWKGAHALAAVAKLAAAGREAPASGAGGGAASDAAPDPGIGAGRVQSPGSQTYYQYVDDSGSVQFAATLEQVPPAWRDRAGMIAMSGPPPSKPSEAREARDARTRNVYAASPAHLDGTVTVAAVQRRHGGGSVILYGTQSCGYCKVARAHLEERGVPFEDKDVESDPEAHAEFMAKSGGQPGVPLLDVGGQIMQGYNEERLDQLLDSL